VKVLVLVLVGAAEEVDVEGGGEGQHGIQLVHEHLVLLAPHVETGRSDFQEPL